MKDHLPVTPWRSVTTCFEDGSPRKVEIVDKAGRWIGSVPIREWTREHADEIGRLMAAAPVMRDLLWEARAALDHYADVSDGEHGPVPNRAMSAMQEIDALLSALGAATK